MIQLSNVHKTFNTGKPNQVVAINNINLQINAGEFIVIVGANGSGKTTLLNLLAGNILPDSGLISIDDNNVTRLPEYSRSKWIARIFQNPLLGTAADLSIIDNFRLAALRTQNKGLSIGKNDKFKSLVKERIATLNMGLEDKIEQPIGTLSGGQRQALTLLMSVMDTCKILLLDEPTAALDPRSAEQVLRIADDLIRQYQLTAIMVTHNLKDAGKYGSRIIQMGEGEILKDVSGSEKQNLKQNDIYDWFG
ncbi:ABC transporter ATP-binding protein [Mucilaginibacter phyllosphaerae]|uniref:ABC transport system ATP-binding protein n=1 Tax=Mucilaginibacter phyllosphaerae TaxID=1812349 RepID=A0A4Y8A751_9SPHI|nr:ATP-binding cassette domain-containing protein [Mucilaginibacter phyllosphaerae]MBB3970846.1 putative ABC transport system ATP-binding protein [Mucilaginibacter phyllosphaerae]TEW64218.1 ATP-binding cassette domain-containing protein [Mucilaginibacter phyllosphaerae]GGH04952.1 ABC transporter ATP-binding protein [Mucilaginibacter phyllosphaerae]